MSLLFFCVTNQLKDIGNGQDSFFGNQKLMSGH